MSYQPQYRTGDHVIITGDQCVFGHDIRVGTEVVLARFDQEDGSWKVYPAEHGPASAHERWVGQIDMEPAVVAEVSEVEVARLFGLAPQPHCPTCRCHQEAP